MRTGLIGEKLGHSFSKDIHELLQPYTYEMIPLNIDEFHQFMKERKFDGINVTMPYKQLVFDYLDEIDDRAKRIGAVNCIVNKNGKLFGYNTDYFGFKYLLKHHRIMTIPYDVENDSHIRLSLTFKEDEDDFFNEL